MISFMVLAGPRSATTWVSQLLTTDSTLCLHDPLIEHTPGALDKMEIPGRHLGVAETSAMYMDSWTKHHPAKKVFLWRDPLEINCSLRLLGLPDIDAQKYMSWCAKQPPEQVHHWQSVFHAPTAEKICEYLGVPFCHHRFRELVKVNIQPEWARLPVDKNAVAALLRTALEDYQCPLQ
jgi:hypothetical protein